MKYGQLSKEQLKSILSTERKKYAELKKAEYKLDITRGKPCKEQLDLAASLLQTPVNYLQTGVDCRNYGGVEGLIELRKYFADLFKLSVEEILIEGNSSLKLMFDTVQRGFQFGFQGIIPWNKLDKIKFLCPVPGYDRHFRVTESFGVEMITVPMTEFGPDMDLVESYVAADPAIKGIWCVPKYSNPSGIVYSDEVVDRLAKMKTAAKDFRIFWDNAYCVHTLFENQDVQLKNIIAACREAGNPDRAFMFASTSKITIAGGGVAIFASSESNIKEYKKTLTVQTIGPDKISQAMHLEFLKKINLTEHMNKHAAILYPKFKMFLDAFETEFGKDSDVFSWTEPKGGYFISVNVKPGCAKAVEKLCADCGLKITPAGATYPYGKDDLDSNLRIAPSYISDMKELEISVMILVCAIKIAVIKKLLPEEDK